MKIITSSEMSVEFLALGKWGVGYFGALVNM